MTMADQQLDEQHDDLATVAGVCYFAVVRALEYAARRSKAVGRGSRRHESIPRYLLHTRVDLRSAGDPWSTLLRGAWDTLTVVLHGDTAPYAEVCDQYVRDLIVERRLPDRAALQRLLADVV